MAKALLGVTIALLVGATVLGYLNKQKYDGLKAESEGALSSIDSLKQNVISAETAQKAAEATLAENAAKLEQAASDLTRAQTEAQTARTELAALNTRITESTAKITELESQLAAAAANTSQPAEAPAADVAQLEAKLKELEGQVAAAEEEKKILTEKVTSAQQEADNLRSAEQKRVGSIMAQGLQGRVEAYNPAYNFVVLNIGDRQGAVANAEMVVTRGGNMIGKIRIASVYPTNSVADVVRGTVPQGIQIQPGDRVIYPGQ